MESLLPLTHSKERSVTDVLVSCLWPFTFPPSTLGFQPPALSVQELSWIAAAPAHVEGQSAGKLTPAPSLEAAIGQWLKKLMYKYPIFLTLG